MRSNRFLIVMLLVLVHSFISCDGAAYHLQEDVDHVNSSLSQLGSSADDSDNDPTTEIHAPQHCHSGYSHRSNHSITPENCKPSFEISYHSRDYTPSDPRSKSVSSC
ncbi:hypothetical protein, partial [Pseudoalteromonas sp. S558]|uniref:hypothetical protein n=1 Tax=Pseudoalteromonas sp. S558 TaxID=2066515 RepID=UPI00207B9DB0